MIIIDQNLKVFRLKAEIIISFFSKCDNLENIFESLFSDGHCMVSHLSRTRHLPVNHVKTLVYDQYYLRTHSSSLCLIKDSKLKECV